MRFLCVSSISGKGGSQASDSFRLLPYFCKYSMQLLVLYKEISVTTNNQKLKLSGAYLWNLQGGLSEILGCFSACAIVLTEYILWKLGIHSREPNNSLTIALLNPTADPPRGMTDAEFWWHLSGVFVLLLSELLQHHLCAIWNENRIHSFVVATGTRRTASKDVDIVVQEAVVDNSNVSAGNGIIPGANHDKSGTAANNNKTIVFEKHGEKENDRSAVSCSTAANNNHERSSPETNSLKQHGGLNTDGKEQDRTTERTSTDTMNPNQTASSRSHGNKTNDLINPLPSYGSSFRQSVSLGGQNNQPVDALYDRTLNVMSDFREAVSMTLNRQQQVDQANESGRFFRPSASTGQQHGRKLSILGHQAPVKSISGGNGSFFTNGLSNPVVDLVQSLRLSYTRRNNDDAVNTDKNNGNDIENRENQQVPVGKKLSTNSQRTSKTSTGAATASTATTNVNRAPNMTHKQILASALVEHFQAHRGFLLGTLIYTAFSSISIISCRREFLNTG